ncbi:hypothetical protein F4825DRAFT_422489 [Nemania diffusa]|nr:hypothetical protein F4825DRAFT_422489 [Nemania diffusa]
MRQEKSKVKALGAFRQYFRRSWELYNRYTADDIDPRLQDRILQHLKLEVASKFRLRVEPKRKNKLDPKPFIYLIHFRWVRDKTTFKIGLDRVDDSFIRIILRWTGCRKNAEVPLRFHEGDNQEMVPTWYPFIEEKHPMPCPLSYIPTKIIAEKVIDHSGYNSARRFFHTRIGLPVAHVPWKKEFWHKPVFRRTIESIYGPVKSDEPVTVDQFDNNSNNLGEASRLYKGLKSYNYR